MKMKMKMKTVTYNVNSLRQRVSQHDSLLQLLNSLHVNIICFQLQEMKLSRHDLSVDLTFAEGYGGFFSCTRSNSQDRLTYSGVATFCRVESAFGRNEVTLLVAAAEGFTRLLEGSKNKEVVVGDFAVEFPLNVDVLEDVTTEDLFKVDGEGRCVITNHDHFGEKESYICFSPRIGAEEFNYGSRIDHILIARPCLHEEYGLEGHNFLNCHVEECDILIRFKRGKLESTPKTLHANNGAQFKMWAGGAFEGSIPMCNYIIVSANLLSLSTNLVLSLELLVAFQVVYEIY